MSRIPKVIWTYWHDPALPPLVQNCMETWRRLNPDFEIRVLDKDSVFQATNMPRFVLDKGLAQARLSDHIRFELLARYGGIWMDASCICTESLKWVLDAQQDSGCELVAFWHWTTTDLERPIFETFFLAATPKSPYMTAWNAEMRKLLTMSDQNYIDQVRAEGIHFQNLDSKLPYLIAYLCATAVYQRDPKRYKIKWFEATGDQGPYKWMIDQNWDVPSSLRALCTRRETWTPVIKLHNHVRSHIDSNKAPDVCDHPLVHPEIRSVLVPKHT